MTKNGLFRASVVALMAASLAACASMQAVDVQDAMRYPPPAGVDVGSLVEIRTLDGRDLRFRVTEVNTDGLDGKHGHVAYEDMARLRVEKLSSGNGNAARYILGALGFLALIALIEEADTVRICSTPPCEAP